MNCVLASAFCARLFWQPLSRWRPAILPLRTCVSRFFCCLAQRPSLLPPAVHLQRFPYHEYERSAPVPDRLGKTPSCLTHGKIRWKGPCSVREKEGEASKKSPQSLTTKKGPGDFG